MLNFVLKSAAYAVGSKLVYELYPPTKKLVLETVDSVQDFLGFNEETPKSKATPKGYYRCELTKEKYTFLMRAYEANKALPKEQRLHQDVLVKSLNDSLELKYSRSGYQHYWQKRIIPKCAQDEQDGI